MLLLACGLDLLLGIQLNTILAMLTGEFLLREFITNKSLSSGLVDYAICL